MNHEIDWNAIARGLAPLRPHQDNPQVELLAARDAAILSSLEHYRLLQFSGKDAREFLQNQLTCDLLQLGPNAATYGGYCSPKGRLVANFLLFRTPDAYLMWLPAGLIDDLALRLRKFVLRSRVEITAASGLHTIGLAGPGAAGILGEVVGEPPHHALEQVHYPDLTLTRLSGNGFLLTVPVEKLAQVGADLAGKALPAGTAAWDWTAIQSGIAWITPGTQEQFIPQMIGLDALGGVSFQKGCYPGQEIVARARYLGEVKRHLRFGHCESEARTADALVDAAGQARGIVVNAAPAPGTGVDVLAVVVRDAGTELRLGDAAGPRVTLRPDAAFDSGAPVQPG